MFLLDRWVVLGVMGRMRRLSLGGEIGCGGDLREALREHRRKQQHGYGYYARMESLDKPVFELTWREREKWAERLDLEYGDVVICCGEKYRFMRVGGIDDGNPWIYVEAFFQNGNEKRKERRLCVWRKVLSSGKTGKRQPLNAMGGYVRCCDTNREQRSGV